MHTGYLPTASVKYPSFGSIVAQQTAHPELELPAFVRIGAGTRDGAGGGILGIEYDPFLMPTPGKLPTNTALATGVPRFARRLDLLSRLEADYATTAARSSSRQPSAVPTSTGTMRQIPGFATAEMGMGESKRVVGPSSVAAGEGWVYVGNRADSTVCAFEARTLARRWLLAHARVYHLADEHRVIALLDRADEAALDVGGGVREDGRARAPRAERLSGERRPLPLGGLEEREGHRLLAFAEHVEREGLRLLDERVRVGIDLDAHGDERRGEGRLRDPVHGGRGDAGGALRRQHEEPVGNHAQRGLLGVRVHGNLLVDDSVVVDLLEL
jgi:hypothetical protein